MFDSCSDWLMDRSPRHEATEHEFKENSACMNKLKTRRMHSVIWLNGLDCLVLNNV